MGTNCSGCACGRSETEGNTEVDFNDDQTTGTVRIQGLQSSSPYELSKQAVISIDKITRIQAAWRGYHCRKLYTHVAKTLTKCHFSPDEAKEQIIHDIKDQEVHVYEYRTGAKYSGNCRNGAREGFGVMIWKDGARYEGQWLNNKAHGFGKFIHADGDVYEGYWKNDRANGKGTYTQASGARYEGEWENDIQHGFGKEVWKDGSCYEGSYVCGKKQGKERVIRNQGYGKGCGKAREGQMDRRTNGRREKWPDGQKGKQIGTEKHTDK